MRNKTKYSKRIAFCFLLCISAFLDSFAQTGSEKKKNEGEKKYYCSLTIFTDASMLFSKDNNKLFNLNFPYSSTNTSGQISTGTFIEQNKNVYTSTKIFLIPICVEIGSKKHFINIGNYFTFSDSYLGTAFSAGYGKIWYINSSKQLNKYYVIKVSLNAVDNSDNGFNNLAKLGQINNQNNTIAFLGNTANPSFNVAVNREGKYKTYQSKNLDVIFKQTEISLLPKISIENNPFKHWLHFQISIGYNLPIHDNGNLNFEQDDGQGHNASVGKSINLNNASISASYNNKIITSTPFHFSGLYVSFGMNFGLSFNLNKK